MIIKKYSFEPISEITRKIDKKIDPMTPGYSNIRVNLEKEGEGELRFTKLEMDEAIIKANQEGYERGLQESESKKLKIEEKKNILLDILSGKIAEINNKSEKLKTELFEYLTAVCATITKKVISKDYFEENKNHILNNLEKLLNYLKEQDEINLELNSKLFTSLKSDLEKLEDKFDIKFNYYENNNINETDCHLKWKNGRVEIGKEKILKALDKLILELSNGEVDPKIKVEKHKSGENYEQREAINE